MNNFDFQNVQGVVSYAMVYTPCFEELYFHIRTRSGWFCETSFLGRDFTVGGGGGRLFRTQE